MAYRKYEIRTLNDNKITALVIKSPSLFKTALTGFISSDIEDI
jgi:hypothetical protein